MSRSRELVEDAKKTLTAIQSPSLQGLSGDWYFFSKEGHPHFVEWVDHNGWLGGDLGNGSFDEMLADGWQAEAVLIYKVIADR